MYASPFYPTGPSGLLPGFLCLGQVRVPYPQRWAVCIPYPQRWEGLCAISTGGGQVCVPYLQRWVGLGAIFAKGRHVCGLSAISIEVDRFVCHSHRCVLDFVRCPQRWAELCAISTEVGRIMSHDRRAGQDCVSYP
jgi:hypothetical protein